MGCLGGAVLDAVPIGAGRVLLVCVEVVERVCVPVTPGWAAGPLPVVPVPVGPDRGVEALNASPFGAVRPAAPGWELLGCLGADVPGCPCVV